MMLVAPRECPTLLLSHGLAQTVAVLFPVCGNVNDLPYHSFIHVTYQSVAHLEWPRIEVYGTLRYLGTTQDD